MYFLDFDRTIFDTDAFITYLKKQENLHHLAELPELALGVALEALVLTTGFSFRPGELAPFLYPDAVDFLRTKENSAMIITLGNPALQKEKVKSATNGIARVQAIYTGLTYKGDYLAAHMGMYGTAPVLVDDSPHELEILARTCPTMVLYEMRRDGGTGDGRWPVIHALTELP